MVKPRLVMSFKPPLFGADYPICAFIRISWDEQNLAFIFPP